MKLFNIAVKKSHIFLFLSFIPYSDWKALIHLIKMNVGIGVMAMPTAFYNGGTVFGIVAMSVIAITTIHCMHILVSSRIKLKWIDFME